jgi:hypothetical protein
MRSWNRRVAVASVLACLAASALAADPAQDCTVCRDPMWPTLENPMPGVALNVPAAGLDPSAIQVNATPAVSPSRSNGIGVGSVAVAAGSVYTDPMWPRMQAASAGIGVPDAGVAAPRAAPARTPATSPLAAR